MVSFFQGKQPDMHVRIRVHDIQIYSDYTGRRYIEYNYCLKKLWSILAYFQSVNKGAYFDRLIFSI